MWLWASMSPGKIRPRVSTTGAAAAAGAAAHEVSTQVMVSPSINTSPANATVGVTTVPRSRSAPDAVPAVIDGASPVAGAQVGGVTGTQAPASHTRPAAHSGAPPWQTQAADSVSPVVQASPSSQAAPTAQAGAPLPAPRPHA